MGFCFAYLSPPHFRLITFLNSTSAETAFITATMGVDIETMKEGDGATFPAKGQKVTCHYTLTLTNGKKIDSSRDRGEPFSFKIGKGEVIQGWDQGLGKMSVGQRAKLTISPDSTLVFDVELLKVN